MKANKLLATLFLILIQNLYSQTTPNYFDNTGKLYLGAEGGLNVSASFASDIASPQVGIGAEYFFGKRWSILAKIKYTNTKLKYYTPSTYGSGGPNPFDHSERSMDFKSNDLLIPINAKWEYPITPAIHGYLSGGLFFDFANKYTLSHSENIKVNIKNQFVGGNFGVGFLYNLGNGAVFLDGAAFSSYQNMVDTQALILSEKSSPANMMLSVGYKYNIGRK